MKINKSSEANQMGTIDKIIKNSQYIQVSQRIQGNIKYIRAVLKVGYNTITANICYNAETNKYAGLLDIYKAQHQEAENKPKYEDMSQYNRDKAIKEQQQLNNAHKQGLYNRCLI